MNTPLLNRTDEIEVSAYCRVSTLKNDQLNSYEYQHDYFSGFIKQFPNFKMYKVYADKGKTATSMKKREEFLQMLYDAGLNARLIDNKFHITNSDRTPKFKYILIKDVSRFARDILTIDVIRELRAKGVFIYFTTINKSTADLSDDFMVNLLLLFAQQDSVDKSAKVKFGQEQGAKKGVILTADKFYGYKYLKEGNKLEVVEEEAKNIRKIYELYLEGNGFRKILQYLDQNNIRTRAGKKFVQQSVKRMLENPAYKGWLVRNKMDAPQVFSSKTYATVKDEKEWIIHKERIPVIINEGDWDKVQEIKKTKVHYLNRKGIHKPTSQYAGLIICGECGNTFVKNREPRNGRDYYNCRLKKKEGIKACHSPNIDKSFIDGNIVQLAESKFYESFMMHRDLYLDTLQNEVLPNLHKKIDKESTEEVSKLQEKKNKLEKQKAKILDLYLDDEFDKSVLDSKNNEIEETVNDTNKKIGELSLTNEEILNMIDYVNESIEQLKQMKPKKQFTKEEMLEQVSKIMVLTASDKKLILNYEFKNFDVFDKLNEKYEDVASIGYWPSHGFEY